MKPLNICILWHQHQPYYRKGNCFILPWVRFHSVKDYLDLPLLLDEFPGVRQTFNIVPSLLLQIEEYTNGNVQDSIQILTRKPPSELSFEEKEEILNQFFVCNYENLIQPNPRFLELYRKAKSSQNPIEQFEESDFRDLQVWYNLTWVGQLTRLRPQFQRFFKKDSNFTEAEKQILLELHLEVMSEIVPTLKRLQNLGQIELSVSPFYHPILPLLCNSKIAEVGLPDINLSESIFSFPQDAHLQLSKGKKFFAKFFGKEPFGVWPSEGSLSEEVLQIIATENFHWTATDSSLLFKTIDAEKSSMKYFPFKYSIEQKELFVFFRDTQLSDSIGFTYQRWNPTDAVNDFIAKLSRIRESIVNEFGEDSLEYACVPIILDGENCWEFYRDNGLPFLRGLFSRLENENWLATRTFSDITKSIPESYPYTLQTIFPGSWINANFSTWIGQPEKQVAWQWLAKARNLIEQHRENEEKYSKAMEIALIAEGSDWFWWYGDDNIAPNKDDFDILFRFYLQQIYEILEEEIPEELNFPLGKKLRSRILIPPSKRIHESNYLNPSEEAGWGKYYAKSAISTMHSGKTLLTDIFFGNSKTMLLIALNLTGRYAENGLIEIVVQKPMDIRFEIRGNQIMIESEQNKPLRQILTKTGANVIVGISLETLFGKKDVAEGSIEFFVRTNFDDIEQVFPPNGVITFFIL